jgi:hypothetical protein
MTKGSRRREFSLSNIVKQTGAKAPLALLALFVLTGFQCGKRTPPQPPRERVEQRAELTAFQRGSTVILSWKMPARNAPPSSVLHIDRVEIYRLAEPLTSPLALSEAEFASRAMVIGTQLIEDGDFGLKTVSYRDTLQFAGQPIRLRYSVRFVNASGQRAAFSNFVLLEPAASVAGAPASLSAEVSQDAITLTWERPVENVDGTTPVNLIGFNVYRSDSEKQPGKLLNNTPITDSQFPDRFFEFEKKYFYFVRAVSSGTEGEPVESGESNIVEVMPVDTFAPSPPFAITLAASPTTISIFFPSNPETDITGYSIYRSTDPDLPLDQWELLTPELTEKTTYEDTRVESGKTYYYYITATDRFKNVSDPSEIVSETVP